MPDWRDDVCTALTFWINAEGGGNKKPQWRPIGPARRDAKRGWYSVDARGRRDIDLGEFRIGAADDTDGNDSYPVTEAVLEGSLIRVKIAEFAQISDAHLWQRKPPNTFLITALRDGIESMTDPGLAHELAFGRLSPAAPALPPAAGFTPAQQSALASCLAPGIRLVWGPPGTGKTLVLGEAIGRLIRAGKRVLLVSATNIAVDNALLQVIRHRYPPGHLVRVGPPHHPAVASNPDVSLTHLVRAQLAEKEQRRLDLQTELVQLVEATENLQQLEDELADFDPEEYAQVNDAMTVRAQIPKLTQAVKGAEEVHQAATLRRDQARTNLRRADSRVHEIEPTRQAYLKIGALGTGLDELATTVDELHAKALHAVGDGNRVQHELEQAESSLTSRLRQRSRIKYLRADLQSLQTDAAALTSQMIEARELLERRRKWVDGEVRALLASVAPHTQDDIRAADNDVHAARREHEHAEHLVSAALAQIGEAKRSLRAAEAVTAPTKQQLDRVLRAELRQFPQKQQQYKALRAQILADAPKKERLERRYAEAQKDLERHRKNAEKEVIEQARVVATTLARFRTNSVVMEGPYDVVLVDEVSTASLPEALLAVSRAARTAVLLGDFMQLGSIVHPKVKQARRADVQRWLIPDVFSHCGIESAQDAQANPGCTALDVQHRFGLDVMRVANAVAYGGLLRARDDTHARPPEDPEIVFIDVDGLGSIAEVHATGKWKGWWPAGALLSRVLADLHHVHGESTGVVTPYGDQVEATLEAIRDASNLGATSTEVGTAHRFQGREFPVVVFDLVEDEFRERWMARARWGVSSTDREGMRLFNVAVTRTQRRLYVIGSRKRVMGASATSPLAVIAALLREQNARSVRATHLITPDTVPQGDQPMLGGFGQELAEVLSRHVRIEDIDDELSFYKTFSEHLASARRSIWIWSPWIASRSKALLPILHEAVRRGVRVTLFVRDPSDNLMQKQRFRQYLADARRLIPTVVEVNIMHQKIVVIDDQLVLLGSLNTLSQNRTREVMLSIRGHHFARRLLKHEHAEEFAKRPDCGTCGKDTVDLRRYDVTWRWRCHASSCPDSGKGRYRAWTKLAL